MFPEFKVQKEYLRNTKELDFCSEFKVVGNVTTQTFAAQHLLPSLGTGRHPATNARDWPGRNSQF